IPSQDIPGCRSSERRQVLPTPAPLRAQETEQYVRSSFALLSPGLGKQKTIRGDGRVANESFHGFASASRGRRLWVWGRPPSGNGGHTPRISDRPRRPPE